MRKSLCSGALVVGCIGKPWICLHAVPHIRNTRCGKEGGCFHADELKIDIAVKCIKLDGDKK